MCCKFLVQLYCPHLDTICFGVHPALLCYWRWIRNTLTGCSIINQLLKYKYQERGLFQGHTSMTVKPQDWPNCFPAWRPDCLDTHVNHWKNHLRASCRGHALWPRSRFPAVAHRPPFPLLPGERLRVPLLWQSQRADSPLRDTQLWPAPAHRWVTCCEAKRGLMCSAASATSPTPACKTLCLSKPPKRCYLVLCKAIGGISAQGQANGNPNLQSFSHRN